MFSANIDLSIYIPFNIQINNNLSEEEYFNIVI